MKTQETYDLFDEQSMTERFQEERRGWIIKDDILRKYDNDPYFVRLFTQYSELLGTEVKKSTLQSVERKKQIPVTFYNGK